MAAASALRCEINMNRKTTLLQRLVVAIALAGAAAGAADAEHVKFDAVVAAKGDVALEFADGSQHVVRLVQREGPAKGEGSLSGATLLEWGMHDMNLAKGYADGTGYLVATKSPGDMAYLKFQWRAIMVKGTDGKPMPLLGGQWEVVGATGKLKGLTGLGTMRIEVLEGSSRHWMFEGELIPSTQ
jgi:hypothetical protein